MFLYAAVPQANKWNLATDLNMSFLRFKAAEERERDREIERQDSGLRTDPLIMRLSKLRNLHLTVKSSVHMQEFIRKEKRWILLKRGDRKSFYNVCLFFIKDDVKHQILLIRFAESHIL